MQISDADILCDLYEHEKYERFTQLMGDPESLPCNFTDEHKSRRQS